MFFSIHQGILRESPKGLVSLNFGLHACIHMGTEVDTKTTASPPTRQSINILLSNVLTTVFHGLTLSWWDLAECLERLAVNAKVATVLGSIPAYFGHSGILGAAYEAALNYVVKKWKI